MPIESIRESFIHPLIDSMAGQNYWLNGCLASLMECLGESPEYDYWFFSGVTADSFTQMFSKDPAQTVLCYSDRFTESALQRAFAACGYSYEYIKGVRAPEGLKAYHQRIRQNIDRNIPVLTRIDDAFHSFAIICAYDNSNFYTISGEETAPTIRQFDELVFVTEKHQQPSLAEAYRSAVLDIPNLVLRPATPGYSFGIEAFRDWAGSFLDSTYDAYSDGDKIWFTHPDPAFTCWNMHGTYLCMLGTNGCAASFLSQALALNADLGFINDLIPIFNKLAHEGFHTLLDMEGGFGLQPKTIKNKVKMQAIADEISKLARYSEEIVEVFTTRQPGNECSVAQ
ncbi:MAG: hypothetical protein FWH40_08720 [Coriobacteriia bacterium]|nr:hypothetical protein [Coriobacteriia bacterium]